MQSDPGEAEQRPSAEVSRAKRRSLLATGNARPVIQPKERSTSKEGLSRLRAGSKSGSCTCFTVRKPSRQERARAVEARALFEVWKKQNVFHQTWCAS